MSKPQKKYTPPTLWLGGIWVIIIVSLFFWMYPNSLGWLSSQTPIEKSEKGTLTLSATDSINLWNIPMGGGKVSAKFPFRNTGSGILTIRSGQTSCMCTEAVIQKNGKIISPTIVMPGHSSAGATSLSITLNPNEEAELIAIFDPMAHGPTATGPIKRDVTITTDSAITPEIRFSFFGTVTE